jgi:ApbE superfamily uncharacterized protein (UPF0280 family)
MRVTVQETDLSVYTTGVTPEQVREAVIEQRGYIEGYIHRYPEFNRALKPWPDDPTAPPIIQEMIEAGKKAGVGPMAAVAGAVAQTVGRSFLPLSDELIIENGGDIFLSTRRTLNVGIYAGHSPLSLKVGLKIKPSPKPQAICTSSGTVGHSLSHGKADAVCVVSRSCPIADAGATAIGNHIKCPDEIGTAIEWGRKIPGILGILVIIEDKMGMWGELEMTSAPPLPQDFSTV